MLVQCFSSLNDETIQIKNCTMFVTVWSIWSGNRQLVMEAILFARY